MVFSSLIFLFAYLAITLVLYYAVPFKARNAVLFVVSLIFYGWGEPKYIVVMLFSILVAYIFGFFVGKYRESAPKKARAYLIVSIILNLSALLFFKYANFFIENLALIPGLGGLKPIEGLKLPVGISFYTFQIMSYTIDVYRGDARVQRRIVPFGAYVTLFPQLIAGPIVRYSDVDEQLTNRRETVDKFASGVQRFCAGLAKKVLLADTVYVLLGHYHDAFAFEKTVLGAWLIVILYTFQIYFDFSGYSDMAIGLGRMLGFEFLENFNYPYISKSITEFWRRWHISLSTWFREYVYIPQHRRRLAADRLLARRVVELSALGRVFLRAADCRKAVFVQMAAEGARGARAPVHDVFRLHKLADFLFHRPRRRADLPEGDVRRRRDVVCDADGRVRFAAVSAAAAHLRPCGDAAAQAPLRRAEKPLCDDALRAGAADCRRVSGHHGVSGRFDLQSVPLLPLLTAGRIASERP